MKKSLPIILFVVGLLVVGGVFLLVVKGKKGDKTQEEEKPLMELSLNERPFSTLTPTKDGHWLNLFVEGINVEGAETLEYELVYEVSDDRPDQGVPGTIKLQGRDSFERELLLGTESTGVFYYDEGVEKGTLTLKFRNDKGKLLARLVTDFRLYSDIKELVSGEGDFKYILDEEPEDVFFVVMNTFGLPKEVSGNIKSGPFAVFSSTEDELPGEVSLDGNVSIWDGSDWEQLKDNKASNIGVFVGLE
jgi:hypothetical protein